MEIATAVGIRTSLPRAFGAADEREYQPFPDRARRNSWQETLEVPALVWALALPAGGRVLEVGCGRGVALPVLARLLRPARLVGLDVDRSLLKRARERTERLRGAVELQEGDVRALPYPDASFDVVIDFGTCYHIARQGQALREIARVLCSRLSPQEIFSMRKINLILLGLALVLFIWMLNRVGWPTIWQHLLEVGWWWPLVLLPYGLVNLVEAVSWDLLLLSPGRPSLARLFSLRLAGEALNTLTPTAGLGGEPFKAARLANSGVPWQEATASVVIHKGVTVMSLALYIFLGLALAPFLLALSTSLVWLLLAGALLLALGGRAVRHLAGQRSLHPGNPLPRAVRPLSPAPQGPRAGTAKPGRPDGGLLPGAPRPGALVPGAVCAGLDDSRH